VQVAAEAQSWGRKEGWKKPEKAEEIGRDV